MGRRRAGTRDSRVQGPGTYAASVTDVINVGYDYDPAQSVTTVTFAVE